MKRKMNEKSFDTAFNYGKKVYYGELPLNEAIINLNNTCSEIAVSSAKHYILWYGKMRTGDFNTWNSNSDLLLFYVKKIIEEEGPEIGKLAVKSARLFAKHHPRKSLEDSLVRLAEANGVELLDINSSSNDNTTESINSWEILDDFTVIKTCDKSFFEYKGSGVPQKIVSFFGGPIDDKNKVITLEIDGKKFNGRLEKDNRETYRIFWLADLGKIFNSLQKKGLQRVVFTKKDDGYFSLSYEGNKQVATVKQSIEIIKEYIAASGFSYPEGLIENFWLCLKSKPFVILAGTSGTGKTRLVRLFAEAISAEYQLIAVRPDWSDSSDLFGHVDLNGNFIPGPVLEFINKAKSNPDKPFIMCLDEMNLARVEYYLSDILSIMETRELNGGVITSDVLINEQFYGKKDLEAIKQYGVQRIPENFYLVGTVNMDETTFPFSRKVLDRANTIEFSFVDLENPIFGDVKKPNHDNLSNSFLKTEYLLLKNCIEEEKYIKDVCSDLQRINTILQKAEAHVGYRVRDEIVFYMLNNKKAGLLKPEEAFDNEIMQKILPRIQGSSETIKNLLCSLFVECAGSFSDSNNSNSQNMKKYIEEKRDALRYPKSADKIMLMTRRFEEDGFTSYWL